MLFNKALLLNAWAGLVVGLLPALSTAETTREAAAVFSTVHNGYVRPVDANGAPRVETYAFAEGDPEPGSIVDPSIDRLRFIDIARALAGPLRARGYEAGLDPKTCDLMILVHWGRTAGARDSGSMGSIAGSPLSPSQANGALFSPSAPSTRGADSSSAGDAAAAESASSAFFALNRMENIVRDRINITNARLLGYSEELADTDDIRRFAGMSGHYQGIIADLEEDRYWVVLTACDFQTLAREKKRKVLWITRFSLRARGHPFDESLAGLADYASRYFGRESSGLRRGLTTVGEVRVGTPTPMAEPPAKEP